MKIRDVRKFPRNEILHADCVESLEGVVEPFADLVFADPPFNIGYQYDVYRDNRDYETYLEWTKRWMRAACRAIKPDGTIWVAIGDEYAAEIKLIAQKDLGLACRSWVIWYYTFGVNCTRKFTRSHAHLFYFVKDPQHFTFRGEDLDNRIPSARQLVYNDSRANPSGRLPDDTWIIPPANLIGELTSDDDGTWVPSNLPPPADSTQTWSLRPQDMAECFGPDEETWYFPRVAGTFKERAGFHGCQMPEQLLGRIIRTCSKDNDFVLDPFSGSGTTLAAAKKLGRRYLGFDISKDYVKYGMERLKSIRVGDRLEGSAEPFKTRSETPSRKSANRRRNPSGRRQSISNGDRDTRAKEKRYDEIQLELTLAGVCEAFRRTHQGFSADRVVADPELNGEFVDACGELGLAGDARAWNVLLFRLRKAGKLALLPTIRRTEISWQDCDTFLFASEIALQLMLNDSDDGAESLDEILCDPLLASEFDQTAGRFAPGFKPLEYRWAALKLRKQAKLARSRGSVLAPPARLGKIRSVKELKVESLPEKPGVYVLSESRFSKIYIGEALNLRNRLHSQFKTRDVREEWNKISASLQIQTFVTETAPAEMLAWQSCLVRKYEPRLNFQELRAAI